MRAAAFIIAALSFGHAFALATAAVGADAPPFVSLGADKIHMRVGPGKQFPIAWTYQRKDLPMKLVDTYRDWRRVVDSEGTEGWMHARLLSSDRTALIEGATRPIYAEPDRTSLPIMLAEPGVIAELITCTETWCQIQVAGRIGWIARNQVFGVLNGETFE